MKKVILTGDRPTGPLHIGHYFGALANRVRLQKEYETYVIIADVQALTDNFLHPEKVSDNVLNVVIDNLAVGIDPKQTTIFLQSTIPVIAELTVFFSNLVTIARLERNPTVKQEIAQKRDLFKNGVTYGFLGYPISQAADILSFNADLVPVGEDQLPVVEQTREIARRFNAIYGAKNKPIFKEPEGLVGRFKRIKGLDGNAKMSKSLNNAIYLGDDPSTVENKIRAAKTDPAKVRRNDPGHPEICTIFSYHRLFTDKKEVPLIKAQCRSGELGCVECKKRLAENINAFLAPIRKKRQYYLSHPKLVKDIIRAGNKKAQEKTEAIFGQVKKAMKIDYRL